MTNTAFRRKSLSELKVPGVRIHNGGGGMAAKVATGENRAVTSSSRHGKQRKMRNPTSLKNFGRLTQSVTCYTS